MRFTQEQIDQAKQVPVERIANSIKKSMLFPCVPFEYLHHRFFLVLIIKESISSNEKYLPFLTTVYPTDFAIRSTGGKRMFRSCEH